MDLVSSTGIWSVLVIRLISLLAFLSMAFYSATLVMEDAQRSYMLLVANDLEYGRNVDADRIQKVAETILQPSFSDHCRSDILRPALSVVLYNLNSTNQARDYKRWAATQEASEAFMASMIRCLPNDGNVWLREALMSKAVAENPASLYQKMTIARALMPYESQQMFARLYFWKHLSPLALSTTSDLATADIRDTLLYGDKELKKTLPDGRSDAFSALLKKQSAELKINPS